LREGIGADIPSWRTVSSKGRASLLLRFIRDVAGQKDIVLPMLEADHMNLESFLEVRRHLGAAWSTDDLEEVALLAELPPPSLGAPPAVNGSRLARAATSKAGLASEFLEVKNNCHADAWENTQRAVAGLPPRRLVPAPAAPLGVVEQPSMEHQAPTTPLGPQPPTPADQAFAPPPGPAPPPDASALSAPGPPPPGPALPPNVEVVAAPLPPGPAPPASPAQAAAPPLAPPPAEVVAAPLPPGPDPPAAEVVQAAAPPPGPPPAKADEAEDNYDDDYEEEDGFEEESLEDDED